jgi:translocator protein
VFGTAWTALYALLAAAGARTLRRAGRTAGLALLPYAAWTALATALSTQIARRDRR